MLILCIAVVWRPTTPRARIDDHCAHGDDADVTQTTTPPVGWILDQRGEGRAVRVSAHVEAGFLVLSSWKSDHCVATLRLLPDEAARLVSNIADGLARLATASDGADHGHRT